ncbi:hypothetical protein M422DRAFT_256388 [Sphaerobolus stellatus SS14]|uniref:F-box domain-containing protein n=1 Tax=Sphaerobolus stellatus (strain SS14) TaxID=990650 RepID=A0A0C9UC49_SPHS4|nr:hypothetical protein M422DRAFT_256388 [Sphaerobolus stellatus SS14]
MVNFPSLQSLIVDFNFGVNNDAVLCFEIFSFGRFPKLKVLRLLDIYIKLIKPGPPATTVLMNSATLPQLREFTLRVWSNFYSRDMTNEAKADITYGLLARHPQLESLAVLSFSGQFWRPLSLERDHCPNVRVLCVDAWTEVTDALSPSLAGQLQKLSGYMGPRSLPLLEHMPMLQECVLHISHYLSISFIHSLPMSIQRLVVTTHPGFHPENSLEYIEYLTRLHNLTHVGGFNWTQSSVPGLKDNLLRLSALTSLEYIGIRGPRSLLMWFSLQSLKDDSFGSETEHLTHSQVFPWDFSWG